MLQALCCIGNCVKDRGANLIPNGKFGAIGNIRISPRHRILIDGSMIEARDLGLEQEYCNGHITYYNLGIEGGHNIIIGGVEVESLVPVSLHRISGDVFQNVLETQYRGVLTPFDKGKLSFF